MNLQEWKGTPKDIKGYQGFVYLLSDPISGKKYIGQKVFWKKIRYPPLKGKSRVRIRFNESDWVTYLGSSEQFKDIIKGHEELVEREILLLCVTKWEMSYYELKEQMQRDVLFKDEYVNGIINVRLARPKNHMC